MGVPRYKTDSFRRPRPGGIRWEKVRTVRQAIARGTYDTPDKWDALLDRLISDLRCRPSQTFRPSD